MYLLLRLILPLMFPLMFPRFNVQVNSYPCTPLERKSLIYQ